MTRKARKSRKSKSRRYKSRRYKLKGGLFEGIAESVAKTAVNVVEKNPGLVTQLANVAQNSDDNNSDTGQLAGLPGAGPLDAGQLAGLAGAGLAGAGAAGLLEKAQPEVQKESSKDAKKNPNTNIQNIGKILKFSLGSIVMSPLYIAAVLANMPLNTIHHLSGKKLSEDQSKAVGIQLYKYMFEGYKKQDLTEIINEKNFKYDDDLTIKKGVIVKCENCGSNAKKPESSKTQKGGYMNTLKTFKEIIGIDTFKQKPGDEGFKKKIMKYVETQNDRIIHKLKEVEYEIDSLKLDFGGRKDELKSIIPNLKTDLLFKCIVVCNTIITDCKEENTSGPVTVVKDMTVILNPYRRREPKGIGSAFIMDVCYLNGCEGCENCTLFKNIVSVYHSYARILLNILRGKANNLYVIINLLFSILKSSHGKNPKPAITLDTSTMKYDGDFEKDIEMLQEPLKLFKNTICKYGMYAKMKEEFEARVKELKDNEKSALLNDLKAII